MPVLWSNVINGAGLDNIKNLNKALRTSIGALGLSFQRPELVEKLNHYTTQHGIYHPQEGAFSVLSKIAIYRALKLFDKNEIFITHEFYDSTTLVELDKLDEFDFVKKIAFKDYYIYSADKEILFTIEWDSFFFLVATDSVKMEKILSSNLFEGFLCDGETTHDWDYRIGEIDQLLASYLAKDKVHEQSLVQAKKWWKFW